MSVEAMPAGTPCRTVMVLTLAVDVVITLPTALDIDQKPGVELV
jgi:hypothetical protein